MPRTYWDRIEDDVLQGLPFLAQLLYLRCLRRYVDFETGIVGVTRRLSYAMFKEVLEVIRDRGSTIREPRLTNGQCRVAIQQLERVDLIKRVRCKGESMPLVFQLRLVKKEVPTPVLANDTVVGLEEEPLVESDTSTTPSVTPAVTESTPMIATDNAASTTACATPATTPKSTDKIPMSDTHQCSVNLHLSSKKNKKAVDNFSTVDKLSLEPAMALLIENGMKRVHVTGRHHQKRLQELLNHGATKDDIVFAVGRARQSTQGNSFSVYYLEKIILDCIHARQYPAPPQPTGDHNGKKLRRETGSGLIAKLFASTLRPTEEGQPNE